MIFHYRNLCGIELNFFLPWKSLTVQCWFSQTKKIRSKMLSDGSGNFCWTQNCWPLFFQKHTFLAGKIFFKRVNNPKNQGLSNIDFCRLFSDSFKPWPWSSIARDIWFQCKYCFTKPELSTVAVCSMAQYRVTFKGTYNGFTFNIIVVIYITNRKYLLRGYILGVLTHTAAWDRLWDGNVF